MAEKRRVIIWFRNDLRLHDHEAFTEALNMGAEIFPVYVFDDLWFRGQSTHFGLPRMSPLRKRFIYDTVQQLHESLCDLGFHLIIRRGDSVEELYKLAFELKTREIFCNRERTYEEVKIQDNLERKLWTIGQEMRYFRGKMLLHTADLPFPITHVPDSFSQFRKEVEKFVPIRKPISRPEMKPSVGAKKNSVRAMAAEHSQFEDLIMHKPVWSAGECAGISSLENFCQNAQFKRVEGITVPLSIYISCGSLSPKLVFDWIHSEHHRCKKRLYKLNVIRDLYYRDFLRFMAKKYGKSIFLKAGIRKNHSLEFSRDERTIASILSATTSDEVTNYLLTKLVETGYINHDGRQYLAQFIITVCRLDFRFGAELFECHLVDYDSCSNWMNWQLAAKQGPTENSENWASTEKLRERVRASIKERSMLSS